MTNRSIHSGNGQAKLLSIEQTAEILGLRPVTVRQWAAARKITRVKLGRRVLIPVTEIERLIEASTIPALPER
jgi:excisionase family DNA binding protein